MLLSMTAGLVSGFLARGFMQTHPIPPASMLSLTGGGMAAEVFVMVVVAVN